MTPVVARRDLAVLILTIGAALVVAAIALRPPYPAPADAPASAFSAHRAFATVQAIAQRPHPAGSPESARVRAALLARLTGMGLQAAVRPGPVPNILAVLPGQDRKAPALMLMAHYDSVAAGPGAGDDAAGVAAALEVVRALRASGPHHRDVMVLLTDGEEGGLLGAKAFFGADPLACRAGLVINFEARGNRGRAVMFETHRRAGSLVGLLIHRGALSGASSLMPDLYRRLPNDTDLTVALKAGRQGLNFAFFGGQAAYHTAADTHQALDLGSLQSLGDQGLGAAQVLADLAPLPAPAPDLVYGDLLGGPVLAYPTWAGWALIGVTLLAAAFPLRRAKLAGRDVLRGAVGFLLVLIVPALLLTLAGQAMAAIPGGFPTLLRLYPWVLAGCGLIALGAALVVVAALTRTFGPWKASSASALGLGGLAVVIVAAAALQTAAPLDAFMLSWPAAAAAAIHALPGRLWAEWLAAAIAVLALAQLAYWAGLLFALVGVGLPALLAPFAALAVLILMAWPGTLYRAT